MNRPVAIAPRMNPAIWSAVIFASLSFGTCYTFLRGSGPLSGKLQTADLQARTSVSPNLGGFAGKVNKKILFFEYVGILWCGVCVGMI